MAKSPSLADSLGKHLECAVCLEQYTEPKVLPCLHSFCKRCLQGLLIEKGAVYKINCPTCRSSAEIPQGQIDSLPANFFVNNLLSMVALHEDSGSCNLECDICDSGDPPVNRCTSCSHFLCEFCTQGHRRGRSTRSHSLMSLEEAKKMGSVAVTKPSLCKEHEGEVMKLFCETCEEAICRDCTIVKHHDHKYTFVKDAFSTGKESLLKILSETKTKVSVLKDAVDGVSEMERNVHSCAEQTMQAVVTCFNKLTACLDARQRELMNEVKEFRKAKLKSLEIQKEQLETALASVQSSVEFTEKAFENGSEVEILNMRKQMSSRLQDLNSATWQLEPCVNEGLKFKDQHDCQLEGGIATFGTVTDVITHAGASTITMGNGQEGVMYNTLCGQPVEFKIIAKEQNGRNQIKGGDVFDVHVRINADDFSVNSLLLKVNDSGDGTYSFSHTPKKEGCYLLSVVHSHLHVQGSPFLWSVENWGQLVQFPLAGNNSARCQIQLTDETLTAKYTRTCIPPGFQKPSGITVGSLIKNQMTSPRQHPVSAPPFGYASLQSDRQGQPQRLGNFKPVFANAEVSFGASCVGASPFSPTPLSARPLIRGTPSIPKSLSSASPLSANAVAATATYIGDVVFSGTCSLPGLTGDSKFNWTIVASSDSQNPSTDTTPFVEGLVGFSAGKHMWKVQIFGSVLHGFCFGIRNHSMSDDCSQLGNWWVWSSKQVHQLQPALGGQARRGSTISDCASGDTIELYLDCEQGTLMIYNPRTKQSDTLDEVTGEVYPVFRMTCNGDKLSLKVM